jgi:hypothetical protein
MWGMSVNRYPLNAHLSTHSLDIEWNLFLGSSSHCVESLQVLVGAVFTPGCSSASEINGAGRNDNVEAYFQTGNSGVLAVLHSAVAIPQESGRFLLRG